MLLINTLVSEVDRHEAKESKTEITGQQRHKDKQHKLLNHMSNLVSKSFPLETVGEGVYQFEGGF